MGDQTQKRNILPVGRADGELSFFARYIFVFLDVYQYATTPS
jgi:hypothetical protein